MVLKACLEMYITYISLEYQLTEGVRNVIENITNTI